MATRLTVLYAASQASNIEAAFVSQGVNFCESCVYPRWNYEVAYCDNTKYIESGISRFGTKMNFCENGTYSYCLYESSDCTGTCYGGGGPTPWSHTSNRCPPGWKDPDSPQNLVYTCIEGVNEYCLDDPDCILIRTPTAEDNDSMHEYCEPPIYEVIFEEESQGCCFSFGFGDRMQPCCLETTPNVGLSSCSVEERDGGATGFIEGACPTTAEEASAASANHHMTNLLSGTQQYTESSSALPFALVACVSFALGSLLSVVVMKNRRQNRDDGHLFMKLDA